MSPIRSQAHTGQQGFSLIELMIAIVCTVVIGGAILGMLVAGNNAFQREPALADRQQNVRVAMDLIQKDIATAGSDMDRWVQSFIRDDVNGALLDGLGPVGPDNVPSDHLQIIGNPGTCPTIPVRNVSGVTIFTARPTPGCFDMPTMVFLQGGDGSAPPYSVAFACDPTATGVINFPPGQDDHNLPGAGQIPQNPDPTHVSPIQVVRYMIRVDPPPLGDGQTPNLWRSPTAGLNPDGTCVGGPAGGGTDGFQLVARGIEDLQVVYILADAPPPGGTRVNTPPVVVRNNPATLVREVEVTLIARTMESNLVGGTDPVAPQPWLPRAIRQHLRSTTTPRAALLTMAQVGTPPVWR